MKSRAFRATSCVGLAAILAGLLACGGGGEASAPPKESLPLREPSPLPAFELLAPIHNSQDGSLTPKLRWTDLEEETGFSLEIDETEAFSAPFAFSVSSDVTEFSVPSGILKPHQEYFWRISALGLEEVVVASNAPFSFQTHPWAKAYALIGEQYTTSMEATSDGGFIVAGYTTPSNAWTPDAIVTKLADDGSVVWQKTYGTPGADLVKGLRQTSDGGYILTGQSKGKLWLAKLDANGMVSWSLRDSTIEEGSSVVETPDGMYAVVGHIYASGAFVAMFKPDGTLHGSKTYGIPGLDHSKLTCIQAVTGGLIAGGSKHVAKKTVGGITYNEFDLWLLKLTVDGTESWEATYGYRSENSSASETAYSVLPMGGNFIVTGSLNTNDQNWILSLNSEGKLNWHTSYVQKNGGFLTSARSIKSAPDGKILLAGKTLAGSFDGCLLKINPNGSIEEERRYGTDAHEAFSVVETTASGEYVLAGTTKSTDSDLWVVKSYEDGNVSPIGPMNLSSWTALKESKPYGTDPLSLSEVSQVGAASSNLSDWPMAIVEVVSTVVSQAP